MADLDFSGGGTPISGSDKAPDFASQGTPLRDVGAGEAASRGFLSGGGKLLETFGELANQFLPAPGVAPNAQLVVPEAQRTGASAIEAGKRAEEVASLAPDEALSSLGSRIAFQGGELAPQLAAAIGTGGGGSLEALAPTAVRSVPVLGRIVSNILAGAPTAGALTAQQAATAPEGTTLGDVAKMGGINLALAGVPGAIGSGPLIRPLSGAAIGGGLTAGQRYLEGQPQDTASTILGAITGAALAGGHPSAQPLDPYLANYVASRAEAPAGPRALPSPAAPTTAAESPATAPASVAPIEVTARQAPTPAMAEAVFKADPKVALASLDHPTLVQVAQDAGFDVTAKDKPEAIVQTMLKQGTDYLHSDVLPEYVAAVTTASKEPGQPAEVSKAVATPQMEVAQPAQAESLPAGQQIAVDASGNAFTPAQGAQSILGAVQAGQQRNAVPALPEPRITVDSAGNADSSQSFMARVRQADAERQALQAQQQDRTNLGLTPDIERTQRPRWQQQEVANRRSAQEVEARQADAQAIRDYAEPSDLAEQGGADVPPWWLAGQHAEAEHEADQRQQIEPLRNEIGWEEEGGRIIRDPETGDVTGRTPWVGKAGPEGESKFWRERPVEGGRITEAQANDAFDKFQKGERLNAKEQRFIDYARKTKAEYDEGYQRELREMEQQRLESRDADLARQRDEIEQAGIDPSEHDEALTLAQLVDRAYDAGVPAHVITDSLSSDDAAQNARQLWDNIRRQEDADEQAANGEAGTPAGEGQDQGRAAARAGQAAEGAGRESAAAGRANLSGNGRERGGSGRVAEEGPAPFAGMTRDQFLGNPKITSAANASDLKPKALTTVRDAESVPFKGGLTAKYSEDGAAVFDGDKPVASYNFGDTLVVDPKYRGEGIAKELVYQWRTRYPDAKPATTRTKASQAIQEKVWDRIQSERGRVEEGVQDSARPSEIATAVPKEDRRDDWSAPVEGRAVTALDDLVERYGGSTLADSIRDDFRATTTAQLVGKTVKSPEDLAVLASVYRNPAFETMRYMFVGKDGIVLGETAVSSRMPSSSVAYPTDAHNGVEWLLGQAPEGTFGVWLVHNHPSGNPKPSQADLDYTGTLSIQLGDKSGAPRLMGHVVLDHGTFGHIDALGDFRGVGKVPGATGADQTRVFRGDLTMFDTPITSPGFAANTGKKIAAATPENSSAIVIMDAQGRVASVHTFPNDFLATPRGAAMVSRLGGKRGAVGIGVVTSRENFIKHHDTFTTAAKRGLLRDAYVVAPDGKVLSISDTAAFPKSYRRNFGQQSAATKARAGAGVQVHEEAAPQQMVSLSAVRRALADRGVSPEEISRMSPAELRAIQSSLRARSAPTPEQTEALKDTGIKNATKAEEREMAGKAEVEHDLSRTDEEVWNAAKERLARDPHAGVDLAAAIVKKPRPISDEEDAMLSQDAMRIKKDRRDAFDVAAKAQDAGDTWTEVAARDRIARLDAQMEVNDQAAKLSGHQLGAGLRARRLMAKEDYSMASLVTQGKVRAGRDLTNPEKAKLEKMALDIEAREKAVTERENALRQRKREPKPVDKQKAARARFDDLAAQLKKIANKDQLKPGCVV